MGIPDHHAHRALVGTKNGSLDEVFNYIEANENNPEFNQPLQDPNDTADGKKKRKKPRFIPIELQRLFSQLQLSDRLAVSTDGNSMHEPKLLSEIVTLISHFGVYLLYFV